MGNEREKPHLGIQYISSIDVSGSHPFRVVVGYVVKYREGRGIPLGIYFIAQSISPFLV